MGKKIRVLVVEDSTLARTVITDILASDPEIEVVGTANNGKTAIFKNDQLDPDVITMDIEMPIMDGLEALKHIIERNPKPVIMLSILTQHGAEETFKALDYGAVDFLPKPASNVSLKEVKELLIEKVKQVYKTEIKISIKKEESEEDKKKDIDKNKAELNAAILKESTSRIVAIGTSTGGPSALMNIFRKLPENFPTSIFVVQHMPAGFTKAFAQRLNQLSGLNVKEAEDGDKILPGWAYVSPGDSHMEIFNKNGEKIIRLEKGEKVSGHMPSIDVLFNSIADNYGKNAICVIMTGMGQDGAKGIFKVKEKGGYTIAQDEETSVVFGMNRVAINNGAIKTIIALNDIPKAILELL